jgi:hypothetical protein
MKSTRYATGLGIVFITILAIPLGGQTRSAPRRPTGQ